MGTVQQIVPSNDAPAFDAAVTEPPAETPDIKDFELGQPQIDPTELNTESLTMEKYDPVPQEAEFNDNLKRLRKKVADRSQHPMPHSAAKD